MTPYKLKILNGVLKLKSFADVVLNILGIKDLGTQTGEVTNGLVDWSIQHLTKTTAEWNGSTYILLKGQAGVEDTGTTTFKLKVGDGISTWQQLGYISGGGANDFPENLFLTVVNKTGDNLLATGYKVLKVQTAQGQRLAVDYALADSDANSADTIGVVYENINNNQTGKIVVIGELTGLNTTGNLQGETWTDGDLLFLSPFVDGGITNIRPTAPNHGVIIGYVVHSNSNNGKIYIKIDNGYEIGELHNCYLPSPNNNDGIFWSSGTTRYENKSITGALGYTPENSTNKGIANGYAPLASDAKIDAAYLPSYVSDVLEYANLAAFPVTGATDKIYIALDTNKVYRWSGSAYIEVAANSGVWGAITGTLSNQTDLQAVLNSKKDTIQVQFLAGTLNPADATTYFFTRFISPTTTAINHAIKLGFNGKIVSAIIIATNTGTTGTSELSTIKFRNITQATSSTISTTVATNGSTATIKSQTVTGLNISFVGTDDICIEFNATTWVTNPAGLILNVYLNIETT